MWKLNEYNNDDDYGSGDDFIFAFVEKKICSII